MNEISLSHVQFSNTIQAFDDKGNKTAEQINAVYEEQKIEPQQLPTKAQIQRQIENAIELIKEAILAANDAIPARKQLILSDLDTQPQLIESESEKLHEAISQFHLARKLLTSAASSALSINELDLAQEAEDQKIEIANQLKQLSPLDISSARLRSTVMHYDAIKVDKEIPKKPSLVDKIKNIFHSLF